MDWGCSQNEKEKSLLGRALKKMSQYEELNNST